MLINEEIRDREVRVIGADGAQLGIMPTRKALELAEEAELDLVKIVPTATPPVCKLMDYDKHRYEQSKREREMRKNQKERIVSLKEVQLSVTIEENDVAVKAKNAVKFLQGGEQDCRYFIRRRVALVLPEQAIAHDQGKEAFLQQGNGQC